MKNFNLILFCVLFLSCNNRNEPIVSESISIERVGLFFSREHGKRLITNNCQGLEIDNQRLRDNVDGNCHSYLFEEEEYFNVIDCDGKSYFVSKKTGEIFINEKHKWGSKLPNNYLGKYYYDRVRESYFFVEETEVNKENVYKYGGNI